MKKLVLIAMVGFVFSTLALADTVSFQTSGTFSSVAYPISFTGVSYTNVGTPTYASLGNFFASGCSSTCSGSESFTLDIQQSQPPTTNTGTLSALITGNLYWNSSNVTVNFGQTSVTLNGITYQLMQSVYYINFNQNTSVSSDVSTPEAGSMLLLGVGLLAFAGISRKLRAIAPGEADPFSLGS